MKAFRSSAQFYDALSNPATRLEREGTLLLDVLDHASPLPRAGSKMGIDATKKWPEEGHTREWPDEIVMSDEIKALVDRRWREYGFD